MCWDTWWCLQIKEAQIHRLPVASRLQKQTYCFPFSKNPMFKVIWSWLFWWVCSNVLVIMNNSIWAWLNAWVIKGHIFWVAGVGASYPFLSMNYLLYDINLPNSDNNTVTWVLCLNHSENNWDSKVIWLKITNYRSETDVQICSSMPKPWYPSFSVWELPRPCLSLCQDLWVQSRGPGWQVLPMEISIGSILAGKSEAEQRSSGLGCVNGGVANGPVPGKKPQHAIPCAPHPQTWKSSLPTPFLPSFCSLFLFLVLHISSRHAPSYLLSYTRNIICY